MTAAAARRLLFVCFGASGAAALVYQVAWVRLSRGNRGCALKAFAAALELDPRDPSVYVNLGYMYVERGDVAAAAGFFSEARRSTPHRRRPDGALPTLGLRSGELGRHLAYIAPHQADS